MLTQIYPDSVPEFRIFKKLNGEQELQVRYVCQKQGYLGKWIPIQIVIEEVK